MKMLKSLYRIFDKKQKIRYAGLVVLMLIGALFETIGLSAIMPIISAVADPASVKQGYMGRLYEILKPDDVNQFIIYMGVLLIAFYAVKTIYMTFMYYIQYRFIYSEQRNLGARLYRIYMNMPYEYYVNVNYALISRRVSANVTQAFQNVTNFTQLMTTSITVLFIMIMLFIVDWKITCAVILLMSIVLFVSRKFVTPRTKKAGNYSRLANTKMTKWLKQSMDGIKEIKVGRHEGYFINVYREALTQSTDNQRSAALWYKVPPVIIESIAMTGIMIYFFIIINSGQNVMDMISVLGVFAMAVIKLMPSVGSITTNISSMSFNEKGIEELDHSISVDKLKADEEINKRDSSKAIGAFSKELALNNVTFKYMNRNQTVLEDVNMIIPASASVGIKGPSGAGKSTALDILLGVLKPQNGSVTIDGLDIDSCYDSYISQIGYIAQSLFMMDDSIRRNVALGIADDNIDDKKVWRALEEAQLAEFVKSLEDGLDTVVGDKALRLSGGQRQRLGIARALYNDPPILIFDEATSSLDVDTEAAVMEAINAMHGKRTLIIVAHRLNTIEGCDIIYNVEDQKITRVK